MRLATRILCWAYTAAAGFLFTGCAVLFGLAIFHHAYHRDEHRQLRADIERLARPADRRPALEDTVALALATACCERWWTSCGTEHDTTHCTRKDQTL